MSPSSRMRLLDGTKMVRKTSTAPATAANGARRRVAQNPSCSACVAVKSPRNESNLRPAATEDAVAGRHARFELVVVFGDGFDIRPVQTERLQYPDRIGARLDEGVGDEQPAGSLVWIVGTRQLRMRKVDGGEGIDRLHASFSPRVRCCRAPKVKSLCHKLRTAMRVVALPRPAARRDGDEAPRLEARSCRHPALKPSGEKYSAGMIGTARFCTDHARHKPSCSTGHPFVRLETETKKRTRNKVKNKLVHLRNKGYQLRDASNERENPKKALTRSAPRKPSIPTPASVRCIFAKKRQVA